MTTKIHAVVDARGLPVAPALVEPLRPTGDVVGDQSYFGQAVISAIGAPGAGTHIPSQSNVRVVRTVDRALCRERNRVERFFNGINHFRGIAANFLPAIYLASARLWIRHYESTPQPARRRGSGATG